MNKLFENENKYATVAGICLAFVAVFKFINIWYLGSNNILNIEWTIFLEIFAYALMAIGLFSRNFPILIGSVLVLIVYESFPKISFYNLFPSLFLARYFLFFLLHYLIRLVAVIFLLISVIYAYAKDIDAKKLCFFPGLLWIGGYLLLLYISNSYNEFIPNNFEIIQAAAFISISLWIKKSPLSKKPKFKESQISNYNNSNTIQQNFIGGADKLKAYKELLDIGAITQEEFEEKKREVLK